MAYEFSRKPKGDLIGSGTYKFRHYGFDTVTDLTGTSWKLSLNAEVGSYNLYSLSFTTNGSLSSRFYAPMQDVSSRYGLYMYTFISRNYIGVNSDRTSYGIYNSSTLEFEANSAYQTISITGGADATNTTLIAWLYANATRVA